MVARRPAWKTSASTISATPPRPGFCAPVAICGSCSACSLQDALQLERLGVPASVVITDAFIDVCGRVAARLGFAGYQPVVVPHPAATRPDTWLKDQARLAAAAMIPLALPAAGAAVAS